jgi:CRP/FNR family cyclic AMP-dependent transcriptional regulator
MGKAAKNGFNPKVFLAKVGTGKTISNFRKDQVIFGQGDTSAKVVSMANQSA